MKNNNFLLSLLALFVYSVQAQDVIVDDTNSAISDTGVTSQRSVLASPTIAYGNGFDLQLTGTETGGFGFIQESFITSHVFSPDGRKLFTIGFNNSSVFQFDVLIPFDLSTADPFSSESFNVGAQEQGRNGITFSQDGTMMFIAGSGSFGNFTGTITRYELSTPFDITTASFSNNTFTTDTQTSSPSGVAFSADGSRMFIVSSQGVFQYDLGTPYDVSSAMFNDVSFTISLAINSLFGMRFSADGSRMFVGATSGNNAIFQYELDTPFDISNVTDNSVMFNAPAPNPFISGSFSFDATGSRVSYTGSGGSIRQFELMDSGGAFIGEGFAEAAANDGSLETTTLDIRLIGDTFDAATGSSLDPADFTINNLPSGLTATITVASSSLATLSLSGTATNHELSDTVESINITFNDSAFTNSTAASICNAVNADIGFGIEFFSCSGGITTILSFNPFAGPFPEWSDGEPGPNDRAIVNFDYDTSSLGNIEACTIEIAVGRTLTVSDNSYIQAQSDIIVNGNLIVNNTGSIVQVAAVGKTINNGAIQVVKTTPMLEPRDFIVLSSPVSGETNGGVYSDADRVFSIISENFSPNTDPDLSGVVANFLDDNGDYLDNLELDNPNLPDDATGTANLLNPGQGYWVFPQDVNDVGAVIFDHTYTAGTLNSGNITVPINYNGPNSENNFNLLGNPYASAIDADQLIMDNTPINEVYFWEHITTPSSDLPGFNALNFSMDDVSLRNLIGGIAAVNGGTVPGQFMASGQGFAILADQTTDGTDVIFTNSLRQTGNNGTPRSPEENNRVWLRLSNETSTLQSTALIGFNEQASPTFDIGYDSKRLATTIGLFSTLEDGKQLAIQGRETFNTSMEISLGFETNIPENEEYTISIAQLEGIVLEDTAVFLIDHVLNTITNLKEASYSFIAQEGMQANRFALTFTEPLLDIDTQAALDNTIRLFPNPARDQVVLDYTGNQSLEQLTIVDSNGRIIMEIALNDFDNKNLSIDTSTFASGIYFVRVQSESNTSIKRLLIY